MVPEGEVRPRGSTGPFVLVAVEAGRTWLVPGLAPNSRYAPPDRTTTSSHFAKPGVVFFRSDWCGPAHAGHSNRSMEALILAKPSLLSALRPVDVRAGAEENLGGFHDRFRQRGMWM